MTHMKDIRLWRTMTCTVHIHIMAHLHQTLKASTSQITKGASTSRVATCRTKIIYRLNLIIKVILGQQQVIKSYQSSYQSEKRINGYQFEDDSEYDSEGSDTASFVSYQEEDGYYYHEHSQPIYEEVPQHYNHGGTYQRHYQQDQEDSSGNKEESWKDVMDFLKQMKTDQETHNKNQEAQNKSLNRG